VAAPRRAAGAEAPAATRFQVGIQVLSALVSVERIPGHGPQHDRIDRLGDVRVERARCRSIGPDVLVGDRDRGVSQKRWAAAQKGEQGAAGRVYVRASVDRSAGGLLGRDVRSGPDHGRGFEFFRLTGRRSHQVEADQLDLAVCREHHVAGLDGGVDQAMPMHECQRAGQVGGHLDRTPRKQASLGRQHLLEGAPVDELHHDIRQRSVLSGLFADVGDDADVGMDQAGRVPDLSPEPQEGLVVIEQVRAQHLDRHVPAQSNVPAAMDLARAAIADQFADLVAPA